MHILIAVDALEKHHLQQIAAAVPDYFTFEQIREDTPDDLYQSALNRADGAVGWPKPELLLNSSISLLQLPSIGFDKYLDRGLEEKGDLIFCNAGGTMTSAMAEHFASMMLALARQLPQHIRDMTQKRWQPAVPYLPLAGSTACVVGLGDIGTEIVRLCLAFNMRVIGVRRAASKGHALLEIVYGFEQLHEAVAQADHVVIIFPTTPANKNSINAPVFAAMKRGAYFYNLARGALVDEQSLINALASGHLAGAGLDVFETEPLPQDSPLWGMENVVVTPHIGGRSSNEEDRLCDLIIENLNRFLRGDKLLNQVDLSLPK